MSTRGLLVAVMVVAASCGQGGSPPQMVDLSVSAPRTTLAGKDLTRPLQDADVEALRKHADVVSVVPRVRFEHAASGRGSFDGHEVSFELGGLIDGIPASAVADEPAIATRFVDADPKAAAGGPVPVLVSPELIEVYNQRYATVHDLPRLDAAMIELMATRKPVTFTITIGASLSGDAGAAVQTVEATVVGISRHAQPVGITAPIGHVQAWNRAVGQAGDAYTSMDVRLRDVRKVETFGRWLGEKLELVAGPATVVTRKLP